MYFTEQLLLLFFPTPNPIKLNIGNVNPNLLRFGPLFSQYPLMFRTPYTKIYPPVSISKEDKHGKAYRMRISWEYNYFPVLSPTTRNPPESSRHFHLS